MPGVPEIITESVLKQLEQAALPILSLDENRARNFDGSGSEFHVRCCSLSERLSGMILKTNSKTILWEDALALHFSDFARAPG
jgi:hypothetical protein